MSRAAKPVQATRHLLRMQMASQHEVDLDKVAAIVARLRAGGEVPPVVLALYGDTALPLDGHHRMLAHEQLGLEVDAWTVPGRVYDHLCTLTRSPETLVLCGGVPALEVAEAWRRERALQNIADDARELGLGN